MNTAPPPHSPIPRGLELAAAWAWRIAIIGAVAAALTWALGKLSFLLTPVLIALLVTALLTPLVNALERRRLPRGLATGLVVMGLLLAVGGVIALTGRQFAIGFQGLADGVTQGINQIYGWLATGPLHLSEQQIGSYLDEAGRALGANNEKILTGALSFGSTITTIGTGFLLAVFVLIFFLYEGERMWAFLVRLGPQAAHPSLQGAGIHGWRTLSHFVRIQILVALIDAVGIGVGAAIIGVPMALPLGALVFFGSFIPVVGALFTGAIAVLLALASNGIVNAVVMLGIVLVVQQVESHVLQPLIIGKAVKLHPVAVILAVATGSFLAGIPGALLAVPTLAVLHTSVRYIASGAWREHGGNSGDTSAE